MGEKNTSKDKVVAPNADRDLVTIMVKQIRLPFFASPDVSKKEFVGKLSCDFCKRFSVRFCAYRRVT